MSSNASNMSSNASAIDYLNEWAFIPRNKLFDDTFPSKIGMDKDDLENYLYYTFLCTMFHKKIGQNQCTLPEIRQSEQYNSAESESQNRLGPANWHTESDYIIPPAYTDNLIFINTGLYDKSDNFLPYYMIFRKNSYNMPPWYYCGIYNSLEEGEFTNTMRSLRNILPPHVDLLSEKEYIIFKKENLDKWDSKNMNIARDHIIKNKERVQRALDKTFDDDNEYVEFIIKKIIKSCEITTFDYKYAVPYIYFDRCRHVLKRGFLLPIEYNSEIKFAAAIKMVVKGSLSNKKQYVYSVETILKLDMARKDARILCAIQKNWLCNSDTENSV